MRKGVILVNIPKDCRECPMRSLADDCVCGRNVMEFRHSKSKPDWCPIKPLPKRVSAGDRKYMNEYEKGWNDCLDKIGQ